MTCKDCVHYDICEMLRPIEWCTGKTCLGFKNKANFVELPCKVGDMIYLPWEFDGVKSIACLTATHIIFDREHNYVKTDFHTDDEAYYDKYKCGRYEFDDFGKTVFLTKEEAEQKLKGGADNG